MKQQPRQKSKSKSKSAQDKDKRTREYKRAVVYRAWRNMLARCYVTTHVSYKAYGGRGIRVFTEWCPWIAGAQKAFQNFYTFMGNKPTDSHSLDRIDNDGHYVPGNVRWATDEEQANNRRSNVTYFTSRPQQQS